MLINKLQIQNIKNEYEYFLVFILISTLMQYSERWSWNYWLLDGVSPLTKASVRRKLFQWSNFIWVIKISYFTIQ